MGTHKTTQFDLFLLETTRHLISTTKDHILHLLLRNICSRQQILITDTIANLLLGL